MFGVISKNLQNFPYGLFSLWPNISDPQFRVETFSKTNTKVLHFINKQNCTKFVELGYFYTQPIFRQGTHHTEEEKCVCCIAF